MAHLGASHAAVSFLAIFFAALALFGVGQPVCLLRPLNLMGYNRVGATIWQETSGMERVAYMSDFRNNLKAKTENDWDSFFEKPIFFRDCIQRRAPVR
ncbi:hypothetical protein B0H14DRAFT_3476748 [Mycena olivaceomarginata]|nr:hypothetical protein B0H14DRAFT_3476748 [Mycena olivaceomarginata]